MEKAYVCLGSDWDGDGIADGDGDERIRMIRLIVILQHFYSILVTLLLWPLHEMLQVYFPFFLRCFVDWFGSLCSAYSSYLSYSSYSYSDVGVYTTLSRF